jgi:glycosyltransferase involved in cell wall biosynthesis
MKISVVIITFNRKNDIAETIKAFERQTYEDKEIIVVDNASDDGTREMMQRDFPHIQYLWLPENFDIRSINIGIELSSGDVIWRTDDDAYPESDHALETAAAILKNNPDIHIISMDNIEVRSGYQLSKWYPFDVDRENVPPDGYPASAFPGTGAAIRREVFDKVGGFWGFGFEEIDLCAKAIIAGFNVRYFPNLRVLHFNTPSPMFISERWLKITNQFVRFQWKYFPFFRAFYRTTVVYIIQAALGIRKGVKFSALVESFFSTAAVALHTRRNEKMVPSHETLKRITMGRSVNQNLGRFFSEVFERLINKFKK